MAKRTIRRKIRKNKTIRKVMRGCNRGRMKVGGAPIQVHQYAGASSAHANANNKKQNNSGIPKANTVLL